MAEHVTALLAPALGRAAAHDLLAEASASRRGRAGAGEALLDRPESAGSPRPGSHPDQVTAALDPAGYLGAATEFVDAALAAHTKAAGSGSVRRASGDEFASIAPPGAGCPFQSRCPSPARVPRAAGSVLFLADRSSPLASRTAVKGGTMDDAERAAQGMPVRREVLGDEHVDRAVARTTPFTAPFQDLITRYAWGEIWSRPGLSRAERSMITLTALAALRHEGELAMHVRAALRNGLTPEQIGEVLLQVAIYAGVPAANRAFAMARQVLAEPPDRVSAGQGRPTGYRRYARRRYVSDHMVLLCRANRRRPQPAGTLQPEPLVAVNGRAKLGRGYGGDRVAGRCHRAGRP